MPDKMFLPIFFGKVMMNPSNEYPKCGIKKNKVYWITGYEVENTYLFGENKDMWSWCPETQTLPAS